MIDFISKSRESWAKNEAKKMGYNEVLLGKTHASFVNRNKNKFSAIYIKYPFSIRESIKNISFTRVLVVISWGFIGWLIGSLVGYYLFGDAGQSILGLIGIIPGTLWGFKSNWFIF